MSGRLIHELEYHYSDGAFGGRPGAIITIRYYRKMDRFAKYKLANNSNFTVFEQQWLNPTVTSTSATYFSKYRTTKRLCLHVSYHSHFRF